MNTDRLLADHESRSLRVTPRGKSLAVTPAGILREAAAPPPSRQTGRRLGRGTEVVMTFGEALEQLRALARGLDYEADPRAAAERLLERCAAHEAGAELRQALTQFGARVLLRRATREDA